MNITLTEDTADLFVQQQQSRGNDVYWDGWDIVSFTPNPTAFSKTDGAFRNGEWGYISRDSVNADGTWRVSLRNVKTSRRTRS